MLTLPGVANACTYIRAEKAQMKEALSQLPEKLDTPVGEGGDAFSVGERQLLCLARSILAESKLLIMDECTAYVYLIFQHNSNRSGCVCA